MSNLPPHTYTALLQQQQQQQAATQQAAAQQAAVAEKQSIFDIFFYNSRWHAPYKLPNVTHCVAVLPSEVKLFESYQGVHAEAKLIQYLISTLPRKTPAVITLYINYSPCYSCTDALQGFIDGRDYKKVSFKVIVATTYRTCRPSCIESGKPNVCKRKGSHGGDAGGWVVFNSHSRLTLDAFTKDDWEKFSTELNRSADVQGTDCKFDQSRYEEGDDFGNRSRAYEDKFTAYDFGKLLNNPQLALNLSAPKK